MFCINYCSHFSHFSRGADSLSRAMQGLYWTLPRDRVEELEDDESEEEEGEHMTSAAALVEGSVHGDKPESGGGERGQALVSCSRALKAFSSGITTQQWLGRCSAAHPLLYVGAAGSALHESGPGNAWARGHPRHAQPWRQARLRA